MNAVTTIGLRQGFSHFKESFSNSQDMSVIHKDEVISRLKFIGYIERDEKISCRYVSRQPNTWITSFLRSFLYPDSRKHTLQFVRSVIFRSFEILEQTFQKENPLEAKGLIADLYKAQNGLQNLKETYCNDTKFCCDMDVVIQDIIARLTAIREMQPSLFEVPTSTDKDAFKESVLQRNVVPDKEHTKTSDRTSNGEAS